MENLQDATDEYGNDARVLNCRFCNKESHDIVIDLGVQPVCNNMIERQKVNLMEPFYPLRVHFCPHCYLVQLDEYASRDDIFSDYTYFSSFSDTWLKHASKYVDWVTEFQGLNENSLAVELASNDGYLLRNFVAKGIPVLGIEPADTVANAAMKNNIRTLIKFFGVETAKEVREEYGPADVIIGNNVLAHVPDLNDFVGGQKVLLGDKGIITIEFPHLKCLIEKNQFDTIYHAHFSYYSLIAVENVYKHHGLRIFDVHRLETHGGSLRIIACHDNNADRPTTQNVLDLRKEELEAGMAEMGYYRDFRQNVQKVRADVLDFFALARKEGKTVVGYGAPGKGNTMLNYCGIRPEDMPYTVDRSPAKAGKLTPGMRIPVYPPAKIAETKPDYVFILPWNLKEEIAEQMSHIREWGGKFVVPIPELTIF
ncbi:MAG: methyltransferase domain-containing protein [Verrucomicrobiae bacterium]|nr:methyltransferase domain-containing protein [Verrucomicrobiae bacterium]